GDAITIEEVRGTSPTFTVGDVVAVRGRYKLASHDQATLMLSVTRTDLPANATTRVPHSSRVAITRGEGAFEISIPLTGAGFPHVSLYPKPNGDSFGGVYFGRGEWLK